MAKPLNIGMIGYGFMGRAHSNAYRKVSNFFDLAYQPVLKAACARDAAKVKAFADKWGYESTEADWRKLVERKDIDAVDICVPNNLHKEIALACDVEEVADLPIGVGVSPAHEAVADHADVEWFLSHDELSTVPTDGNSTSGHFALLLE